MRQELQPLSGRVVLSEVELRASLAGPNTQAATIALNQATAPLADRMMEAAIKAAVTSKRADQLLESN